MSEIFGKLYPRDFEALRRDDLEAWTTLDGRRILLVQMDNQHLINTIRFLERTYRTENRALPPVYERLVAEGRKRKLLP
jgi:hypothetical protein